MSKTNPLMAENTNFPRFQMLNNQTFAGEGFNFSLTSNVLSDSQMQEQVKVTLDYLSSVLARTLGPYGTTTIVQNSGELKHYVSKDGYSVLKEIVFNEPIPLTILDFIKRISFRLVRTVGDGSTTAVVASNEIYKSIQEVYSTLENVISPRDYLELLNKVTKILVNMIYEEAVPIKSNEDLKRIAYISTNNNHEAAELIYSVFKALDDFNAEIEIEANNSSLKTEILYEGGYKIPRGFINPIMSNRRTDLEISFDDEDCNVFMCHGNLSGSDLPLIQKLVEYNFANPATANALVVIAKDFDHTMKEVFNGIKTKHPDLPIVAIDIATASFDAMQKFTDLGVFLGCTPFLKDSGASYNTDELNSELFNSLLGSCKRVLAKESTTTFYGGNGNPKAIEERIKSLKETVETHQTTEDALERDKRINGIRNRISMISGKSARILVGGATAQEINTNMYLLEDAIYACQSAAEYGVVLGGSMIIPKLIYKNRSQIFQEMKVTTENEKLIVDQIITMISGAFKNVFKRVISHCNNEINRSRILDNLELAIKNSEEPTLLNNVYNDIQKCEIPELVNLITEISERYDTVHNFIFDAKNFAFEDINTTMVINSSQTDIEVLRSTISIISLISTSNQFVSGR